MIPSKISSPSLFFSTLMIIIIRIIVINVGIIIVDHQLILESVARWVDTSRSVFRLPYIRLVNEVQVRPLCLSKCLVQVYTTVVHCALLYANVTVPVFTTSFNFTSFRRCPSTTKCSPPSMPPFFVVYPKLSCSWYFPPSA